MKKISFLLLLITIFSNITFSQSIYDFTVIDIDGNSIDLNIYRGKVVMIVNVASQCGFTYQYEGLESIYREYQDQGFVILGFPANNFLWQEPGSNEEIKDFCTLTYNVSFPMFSKINVKGRDIDPLYNYLTDRRTNPEFNGRIKWNFTKFLIDRDGNIVDRFASDVEPESNEIISAIEAAL